MIAMAARGLTGLITTTAAARAEVMREIDARGGTVKHHLTLPLPLAPGFLRQDPTDAMLAAQRYFVMLGAIEPRKNHALLLRLWPRLITQLGDAAPKLIIVGSPAQNSGPVMDVIATLPGHVIHAPGLSTQAVRILLRGAQALLMPSWAEGFGLPVQEALSLGVRVIASDLPAHREIAQHQALLIPPDQDHAWLAALLKPPPPPQGYRPMLADEYFQTMTGWLREI